MMTGSMPIGNFIQTTSLIKFFKCVAMVEKIVGFNNLGTLWYLKNISFKGILYEEK
jgi:hypothetical protein